MSGRVIVKPAGADLAAELPDDCFRNLICSAGVGILSLDLEWIIRFCNDAAVAMLARPAQEIMDRPILEVLGTHRGEYLRRNLERTRDTGTPSSVELRLARSQNESAHLFVTVSPILQGETKVGYSVFMRDMSRQMRLLRDMAQAQKMAALESMAGAVAHYFNNILGGAVTTADFALASDDPDLHKRTLGITITALSRANELTRGLLEFAEGEHTPGGTVDLRDALERYLASLRAALEPRNIHIEAHLQPVSLAVPAKAFTSILDRLTSNAAEAMPNGGTLSVDLERGADGHAVVRVADTGRGISEEDLSRVFEPFFTTKPPDRNRPGHHPGLGLAVVHGIIKDLRGTISVTQVSAPGTGTIFTMRLPPEHPPVAP